MNGLLLLIRCGPPEMAAQLSTFYSSLLRILALATENQKRKVIISRDPWATEVVSRLLPGLNEENLVEDFRLNRNQADRDFVGFLETVTRVAGVTVIIAEEPIVSRLAGCLGWDEPADLEEFHCYSAALGKGGKVLKVDQVDIFP